MGQTRSDRLPSASPSITQTALWGDLRAFLKSWGASHVLTRGLSFRNRPSWTPRDSGEGWEARRWLRAGDQAACLGACASGSSGILEQTPRKSGRREGGAGRGHGGAGHVTHGAGQWGARPGPSLLRAFAAPAASRERLGVSAQ